MRKLLSVSLLLLLLVIPSLSYAQDDTATIIDPVYIWTAGHIDPTDNSVFYSLFVASGEEPLDSLTVQGQVPEGATFVGEFWKPEGSTFVGEENGTVTWELPAMGQDTITGPFSFHVTFENADAEDFMPPGVISGNITWADGTLAAESYMEEVLMPMEESGSVTLEAEGTLDMVPVGETGAWIMVPEGAVSEAVTLTLTRLPITEDLSGLPEVAEETWWCGQYSVTADKEVTFAEPITILLPIRRALTPNAEVAVFAMAEGGEWMVLSDGVEETTEGEMAFAEVGRDGVNVALTLQGATLGSTPHVFAVGITTTKRAVSTSKTGSGDDDEAPWF